MTAPRRRLTPDELLRSKVGANIKRSLRRLWNGDMEFEELCEAIQPTADCVRRAMKAMEVEVVADPVALAAEMRLSPEAVEAMAAEMGLGERVEPDWYTPTPEEIRLATARFRSGWTPAERESRLQGPSFGRLE